MGWVAMGALAVALLALGTALMDQSPFSSFPFWLPFFEETGGHRRRHLPEYRSFEHEVTMIEQRLIARAMRAYFIAPKKEGCGSPDQPSNNSDVWEVKGKRYVVLPNVNGILAIHRVRPVRGFRCHRSGLQNRNWFPLQAVGHVLDCARRQRYPGTPLPSVQWPF
jgi:hypothetical protein